MLVYEVGISKRNILEITLDQGWATFLVTGPDPSNLIFKLAEGNKKNEYDSCNKMTVIIIIMKKVHSNSISLQLQTSS